MTLTCEQSDELLSAWFEGDLDPLQHGAVTDHVTHCLRCAAIVRDIDAIRHDAANLPEMSPPRDLWEGIAARTVAPVLRVSTSPGPSRRRVLWTRAAAAVLLIAGVSGVTYSMAAWRNAAATTTLLADSGDSFAGTAVNPTPVTSQVVYSREIARLRTILDERRGGLDSTTIGVVEHSLATIDRAIEEARAALASHDSSPFLQDQLDRALQKKLSVLRTVVLMPAEAS